MSNFPKLFALGLAATLSIGSAMAQTAAPAPSAGSPAAATAPVSKPAVPVAPMAKAPAKAAPATKAEHTAKSLECSKQADTKGLHGKERKKFREACKKG